MSRIVVLRHRHEREDFATYLLHPMVQIWEAEGHEVLVVRGIEDLPDADLAILHIDLSLTPEEYREAARRYPRVVNGGAIDVRKRNVSRILLAPGDDWDGRVIAKADLNCFGLPEIRVDRSAMPERPADERSLPIAYTIYPNIGRVPDHVWADPATVVERFLPERDGEFYLLRVFTFFGDGTRNRICKGPEPIVRGNSIIDHWAGPAVPEELLTERERLGMDFGKFDYVMHEGRAVLLDANKTPSTRVGLPREMFEDLAAGLPSLLGEPARARMTG